jgi:predicted DNA-binding transcriptional regulator AlpA
MDLPAVLAETSMSRSSLYRLLAGDNFPKPVRVPGCRRTLWKRSAVGAWVAKLPASK